MTRRQVKNFFDNKPVFEKNNSAWWRGDVGYLLFDHSLLMLLGKDSDRPGLLLIQKLRDIPFLAYDEKRGVIIGSRKMTKEAKYEAS